MSLAELCVGIFDCPHSTPQLAASGPYLARTQDIRSGVLLLEGAAHVSRVTYLARTARATPTEGDLLYSREGTYFGVAAEVPAGVEVCLGQRMVLLRPESRIVESRFIRYWLNSPLMASYIAGYRDGSVAERLNLPIIRELPVAVPPRSEQRAIAGVLGALDNKIDSNRRLAGLLERHALAFFDSSFDTVARRTGTPLGDLVEINPKRGLAAGSLATYIEMADLPTSSALVEHWQRRPAGSGQRFKNGDVLVARITPCLENGKTAFVDVLGPNEIGWGSTEYLVFRSREPLPPEWAYCLARSEPFVEFAVRNMSGTSGRQRCPASAFDSYFVPAPQPTKVAEFAAAIEGSFARMGKARDESHALAALRDALLPELLSGRLRVREAEKVIEDVV
jgi:type I restriction enzyme S subunit